MAKILIYPDLVIMSVEPLSDNERDVYVTLEVHMKENNNIFYLSEVAHIYH